MSKFIKVFGNLINIDNIKRVRYEGDFYDRIFIIYYKDNTSIDMSNNRFREDSYKKGKEIDKAYKELAKVLMQEEEENE